MTSIELDMNYRLPEFTEIKISRVRVRLKQKKRPKPLLFVEYELELSNEYVRQYQSFVRFIEDNIIYLDGFG